MRWQAWLISGAALGCSVNPDAASAAREVQLACRQDADCSSGHCLAAFSVCSQDQGELTRLLFEVTPPASDPVYGGARYLTIADLASTEAPDMTERGIAPGWHELNVRPRVPVSGSVSAAPDQTACLSRARSTLPVTLTFTPRERFYGLPLPSYELATSFEGGEYTFHGSLPPGHYDVYMRPDAAALSESCVAIPQIFRDRSIGETFQLAQPPPRPLQLTLPWRDELEGWVVDMVHPVTGEVISNRVRLSAASRPADAEPGKTRATLFYSQDAYDSQSSQDSQAENDSKASGDELVRLTPPPGETAGTVLLQRSGIVLATPGEGQIADVFKFGERVDFRAWVWKEGEYDSPVPGTVNFAALDLDAVAEGVPTSFNASAMVDERGEVSLQLLPGRYRVRVTPPGIQVANLGLLSSSESTVTVWPNDSGAARMQSGQVIEVPAAVTLTGLVERAVGGQPLDGVEVRASASNPSQDPCSLPSDADAGTPCARARTPVLAEALAQDPFVPRSRSALSDASGSFRLTGLDCGPCEPGAGARFDLSVRPPAELGLPWLVRRARPIDSSESMRGPLRVPAPVAHALRLTYGDPTALNNDSPAGQSVVPGLAGALVRVYALLDERARVVTDPDALVPCAALPSSPNRRCVQSVLQVAELRSGKDGEFLLLLPPNIQ